MIDINEKFIKIDTPNTSLVFAIRESAHSNFFHEPFERYLVPVHYGQKLSRAESYDCLFVNSFTDLCSVSCFGGFDKAQALILIENADKSLVNDFNFTGARIVDTLDAGGFPAAHSAEQILELSYEDVRCGLKLYNYLCTFADTDLIAKFCI